MIPFGQCGWRCVGPCAGDVGVGGADQHALVVDVDHRVGRGLAIDGWSCVVGHAARADGADYRTFVVDDLGNADFYQAGVHGEVRGGAWRALVGSSVFDHAVEAMVTIGQWGAGGEAPVAAGIHRYATDFHTFVIDDRRGARLSGAANGRGVVVGGVVVVDLADNRADVVGQGFAAGRYRGAGVDDDGVGV